MNEAPKERSKPLGWQRAVLVVLALVNLWSCRLAYSWGHPVWALAHAAMAVVLFTLLVITWPMRE